MTMTKMLPILMRDAMVLSILRSEKDPLRKTATRRTSKVWERRKRGDILYVRECHALATGAVGDPKVAVRYRADGTIRSFETPEATLLRRHLSVSQWRPGVHMPRWASRILLRVVSVEREPGWSSLHGPLPHVDDAEARREGVADRNAYLTLFREINGESFPATLWRIEFELEEVRS